MLKFKVLYGVLLVFLAIGFVLLGIAGQFLFGYLSDSASSLRYENLEGMVMSLYISIPFWIFAMLLSYPVRKESKLFRFTLGFSIVLLFSMAAVIATSI